MTNLLELLKGSSDYRNWRKSVFERDNFICQFCGQRGGILNADHIQSFTYFPELRFSIDNGRTLCRKCHVTKTNYGAAPKWAVNV